MHIRFSNLLRSNGILLLLDESKCKINLITKKDNKTSKLLRHITSRLPSQPNRPLDLQLLLQIRPRNLSSSRKKLLLINKPVQTNLQPLSSPKIAKNLKLNQPIPHPQLNNKLNPKENLTPLQVTGERGEKY